ncbi:hypothetical protein [Streptomyces sp. NPDC058108]|uniref:hypothetical protein n=1 Tax=Streptomyces sp. NPDC058108 TaxID=3346344 RepID=UPI0036E22871
MIENYLALDRTPELAVFHTRAGLAVLDLSPQPRKAETARHLTRQARTNTDGYVARDVLAHPACHKEMSHDEHRALSAIVASAGLGQRNIPTHLEQALLRATSIAEDVREGYLTCRPAPPCREATPTNGVHSN